MRVGFNSVVHPMNDRLGVDSRNHLSIKPSCNKGVSFGVISESIAKGFLKQARERAGEKGVSLAQALIDRAKRNVFFNVVESGAWRVSVMRVQDARNGTLSSHYDVDHWTFAGTYEAILSLVQLAEQNLESIGQKLK